MGDYECPLMSLAKMGVTHCGWDGCSGKIVPMVISKTVDEHGRLNLGKEFANRTVLIEQVDETEFRVTMAVVIPERELWLHRNPEALAAVRKGLAEAKAGKFTPLDLEADRALYEELGDD